MRTCFSQLIAHRLKHACNNYIVPIIIIIIIIIIHEFHRDASLEQNFRAAN